MRKHMKQQLTLFTILFILMGCNNTPNAQQTSGQAKQLDESTAPAITEDASEKMRINDDILAIDQKISDLEEQEKLRISKEIKLIQEKIANLEKQETEIDSALTQLETQIATVASKTKNSDIKLSTKVVATKTDVAEISESKAEATKPQLLATTNVNSVHSWGDWANGIKPAAGPAPVVAQPAAVSVPAINFRPNENSAFSRSVVDNTPAGSVLPTIGILGPGDPVPTARPGDRFPRR